MFSHAVVGEGVAIPALCHSGHAISKVVGVSTYAVAKQVAVGVPGVVDGIHAGEAVGDCFTCLFKIISLNRY